MTSGGSYEERTHTQTTQETVYYTVALFGKEIPYPVTEGFS